MAFDSLVTNAGRLQILTALLAEGRQEFVQLRKATGLTDGNLSAHARRLQAGGLVVIEKSFRADKPVTTIHLTDDGRSRLAAHVQALMRAVGSVERLESAVLAGAGVGSSADEGEDESDWVD